MTDIDGHHVCKTILVCLYVHMEWKINNCLGYIWKCIEENEGLFIM